MSRISSIFAKLEIGVTVQVMGFFFGKSKRIYLDFAAATPLHKDVYQKMEPFLKTHFGNASAIHEEGRIVRRAIEEARTSLARMLRVRPADITFTGSGTESNNLALRGLIEALYESGRAYSDMEIITTKIEHPSILETVRALERLGVTVRYIDIIKDDGSVREESLKALLGEKTVLITFSYVNSEIGVVQNVKRITRTVKKFNAAHGTNIKTHLDASQAPLWLPCQMDMLGVDLMTLDAGKCYGPKGIGVLVHLNTAPLKAILFGGGQEGGLRPSTESTALIVGAVTSLLRADEGREVRVKKVSALRDQFFERIEKEIPEAVVNGTCEHRVANNVHISIPGYESEFAVVVLDTEGIAASTRSACGSGDAEGSYVVREIGDESRALSTLRFTLGEETTGGDIQKTVASLKAHVSSMHMYKAAPTKG